MTKRPNRDVCLNYMFDMMSTGATYSDILAHVSAKWHYPKRTFDNHWSFVKDKFQNERKNINEKKLKMSADMEIKAHDKGLKTRFDRLFELQNDAEKIQEVLDIGTTKDTTVKDGLPNSFERPLTEMEKEKLIARKQSILKQIQDMEADALPVKSHQTIDLKSEFSAEDALKMLDDAKTSH